MNDEVEDVKMEEPKDRQAKHSKEWNDWDWGWRSSNSSIWGLLLVLGGGILLAQVLFPDIPTIINAGNWWVIFILVPGFNMITRGWRMFRR
ncbi:MAG: hypothetical protein IH859_06260, partial [Chloroflexi bacterium]|nr:hypothetical protein [Chloroflexota bacterium]